MDGIDGSLLRPWLDLSESRVGHRLVLAATGEVDIASAGILREALSGAAESGAAQIWLDLTNVEFMDSTGITAIVDAHRLLESRATSGKLLLTV